MPIRERGGLWHYRFYVDGREYTGSTDLAATKRNESVANRVEAKARELVKTGRSHELKLEVRTFSEAAEEFLKWADAEHREHPNTTARLRVSFSSLTAFFGKRPVSSILRGDVRDYMAWRRTEHGGQEITLRHDLHALSKAFGYWTDHNWARENAVRGVDIPSDKDAVRMHVLTAEEETVYFTAAASWPNLYDLGRLMLNQGCRPEDILNLEKAAVDLARGTVTVRKGKSRAARRTLRLTAESRAILMVRVADSRSGRWIFPSDKRPGEPIAKLQGSHEKALELTRTCTACGRRSLEHRAGGCEFQPSGERMEFVLYDFRHTFATRAAESGMPVATLAAILGHADLRSVMKYIHVRQEATDRAMVEFDQKVMSESRMPKDESRIIQ